MSTLLQKGNGKGKSYLHVRAGKYQNVNDMRKGIMQDTVFHSSLPYLTIDKQYTITARKASPHSNWSVRSHFFDFPDEMVTDLANDYMFIGVAFSGSTAIGIQTDALGITIYQKAAVNRWVPASVYTNVGGNFIANAGFFFTTKTKLSSTAQFCDYKNGNNPAVGSGRYVRGNTATTVNVKATHWPYLNKYSRSLVYNQGYNVKYNFAYPGPSIDKVVFYRLNLKATTSGYRYTSKAPSSGSIKLSKREFKINGRDYLSGIKHLVFTGKTTRGRKLSLKQTGSTKIPANLSFKGSRVDGNVPPFAVPTNVQSIGAYKTVYSAGGYGYMPAISANNTVEVFGNGDCLQHSGYGTTNADTAKAAVGRSRGRYQASVFEITKIPKVNSIEFGKDLLKINGNYTLYSPSKKPTAMFGDTKNLQLKPAVLRNFPEGRTEVVEDSITLDKVGSTVHLVYSIQEMVKGKYQCYHTNTRFSNNLFYNVEGSAPELMPRIASLRDGECAPVGSITYFASDVSKTSRWGYAIAATNYVLRRRGSKIELVALGLTGYELQMKGSAKVSMPKLKLSVARLFGGE